MKYLDAFGNPILKGKFYGYTQYSNGIFVNNRFVVLECLTVKGSGKLTVKGMMCNDGNYLYGENREKKISEPRTVSLQNFSALWPISEDFAEKDPCCALLMKIPTA